MIQKKYAIFIGLAFELVALVLGLSYIGKFIDEKYSLPSIGIAAGAFLALIIWMFHLVKAVKMTEKNE